MILHHWDTDGICSAAMLMRRRKEDNFVLKIGNYFIDDDDMQKLKNYDEITVVDMNLPDAYKICNFAKLRIYDHHYGKRVDCAVEHFNPSLNGKFYASATLVVREKFGMPFDYLVALGIIGDNGENAKKLPEFEYIEKAGDFDTLLKAVNLIDSSYKINDRREVRENVYLVMEGIEAVIENEKLNRNVEMVEREIEKWVDRAEKINNIHVLKMRSEYNIISSVTRKIVWEKGGTAIVLNERNDRDEIYVRSTYLDLRWLIDMAKKKYRAGGKREVMGAILPKGEGSIFFDEIFKLLTQKDEKQAL